MELGGMGEWNFDSGLTLELSSCSSETISLCKSKPKLLKFKLRICQL